jgi:hypothetical protein
MIAVRQILTGIIIVFSLNPVSDLSAQNSIAQRPDLTIIDGSITLDDRDIRKWLNEYFLSQNQLGLNLTSIDKKELTDNLSGYFYQNDRCAFLALYNADFHSQKISIKFSEIFELHINSDYLLKEIYPQVNFHSDYYSYNSAATFEISGCEFKVYQLIKRENHLFPLVAGIFLMELNRTSKSIIYDLMVDPISPVCADILGEQYLESMYLNDRIISADEFRRYMCKFNKYEILGDIPRFSIKSKNTESIQISLADTTNISHIEGHLGIYFYSHDGSDFSDLSPNWPNLSHRILLRKVPDKNGIWLLIPLNKIREAGNMSILYPQESNINKYPFSVWIIGAIRLKRIGRLKLNSNTEIPDAPRLPLEKNNHRPIMLQLYKSDPP